MFTSLRAGLAAVLVSVSIALVTIGSAPAGAADKAFRRDDLATAALRLETQIKKDAGTVTKGPDVLRREADVALGRNDTRTGLQVLGQLVTVAPADPANWQRLARAILQVRTTDARQRADLSEKLATAAYIAYQRARTPAEEADALALIGRSFADRQVWRPALDALRLSLELRENADLRSAYERLRAEHGFRVLDNTVDADTASPRACFQFSEALPRERVDLSPFVAVAGRDAPAISVEERQLCVEGLAHGERYAVTLRPGLPSLVKETLTRPAEFTIYVRDRKPFVRFTRKAYVLPRTGQRGIPVVSVNTSAVDLAIYRIGDRKLVDPVADGDLETNLSPFEIERITARSGEKVWSGELATPSTLNAEVTTVVPVADALGDLKPGVYMMTAVPKSTAQADDYSDRATQWFIVSDLGLSAVSAGDGLHVFVASLATAAPKAQVEVKLLARNNEILATKRTDAAGRAVFEPGLVRGEGGLAPALVTATLEGERDYGFLNLKSPAFDLSDRGVKGRTAPDGLDAFVVTERGVYRTGETVHATALLRDARGTAALGVPLTLVFERPDGVEHRRAVVADQGLGGRAYDLALVQTAPSGTWRLRAYTDPKRPPVGETSFLVEDYVPDRIEFDLATKAATMTRGTPTMVTVEGRYLYGAPAADLDLDGEVTVKVADGRPGFPGYVFGAAPPPGNATPSEDDDTDAPRGASTTRQPLADLPVTDAGGRATLAITLDKVPAVSQPLEATITLRMAEAGGRAVERKLALPVTPEGPMIGVKPAFTGRSLREGDTATFDVVVVGPDGRALARPGLRYELLAIETRHQWYRRDGAWQYEPIRTTKRVADGALDVSADTPARIAVPVAWGRYRLDVTSSDPAIPATSVGFDAGFYAAASADTPDLLEIALDKPEYRAGDQMTVAVTARTAGRVRLDVVGDRLITSVSQEVQPGVARLTLPVGRDWGNGAYVVANLIRPLDVAAGRMPGRALGVQWFAIDRAAKTLKVELQAPAAMRPNGTLRVPVRIDGLAGREARIVVAAVDVGILNLTGYAPPAPDDWFLGQRRLAAELRDLYGHLIDGMQGTVGQIRSGGDGGGMELSGSPPAQAPLALHSGIVAVKPDGTAEVTFDIPAFAGTVRLMAMAWGADTVGRGSADVVVRDPVVATATLPRFLATGDRSTVQLDLDNVEGAAGDYRVSVSADGPIALQSTGPQALRLGVKQKGALAVPVAASGAGSATVTVSLAGPDGFAATRTYPLAVQPATQVMARRTVKPLARGESLTLGADLLGDMVRGTGSVAVSVGPSVALDAAAILDALDRYPFGCSEQIASRALPLLYANDLVASAGRARDETADQRVREAIDKLLARQDASGGFGLWGAGGGDAWLDAYVTDVLTRARERGFTVPDTAFRLALDRLRNLVANAPEPGKEGAENVPFALYVLARNGSAPVGDLRYLADAKLDTVATPLGKAQIAAALALVGDRARAERVFGVAARAITPPPALEFGRPDYGSTLRDAAAVTALAAEAGAPGATVAAALRALEEARGRSVHTSTQENAWMLLAARALAKETKLSVELGGEARNGPLYRVLRPADLAAGPVRLVNTGDATVQAVVSVSGSPIVPEPPAEKGFKIERAFFNLDGTRADVSKARQNQRFVVVLTVTEPQPRYGRVLVVDHLPAGFEIDNPRLVSSGETGALDWIQDAQEPVNAAFRDDRFNAAFDRTAESPAVFTVAYVVRAVSPGRYVLPQAYVEDMYRPDRFARTGTGTVEVTAARQ